MAGKGGHIPGNGRKKGSINKASAAAKDVINKIIPPEERYGLLAELARGVQMAKKENGADKIYTEKPDSFALKFLSEMADGKAAQSIDMTSKGKSFVLHSYLPEKDRESQTPIKSETVEAPILQLMQVGNE